MSDFARFLKRYLRESPRFRGKHCAILAGMAVLAKLEELHEDGILTVDRIKQLLNEPVTIPISDDESVVLSAEQIRGGVKGFLKKCTSDGQVQSDGYAGIWQVTNEHLHAIEEDA